MMKQNSGLRYNVFINHRGTDVKNSLASIIYNQLKTKDPTLRVFLDKNEIPYGVDFELAIETAIQSSSVHIAIFSERYAESKWCLHELDLIIKSRRKLIPIFCDIDPAALRRIEKGCYKEAFEKHRGREPLEKTKRWEDALARASYLQGLSFKMKESDYWEFGEKIVGIVLMNLKEGSLVDAECPVALGPGVEDFLPFSASELNDLKACQDLIGDEFVLSHGSDDDRPDLMDWAAVSELFDVDDDGPAISELFKADEDEAAINELLEVADDGPSWSELFEVDRDGPGSKRVV